MLLPIAASRAAASLTFVGHLRAMFKLTLRRFEDDARRKLVSPDVRRRESGSSVLQSQNLALAESCWCWTLKLTFFHFFSSIIADTNHLAAQSSAFTAGDEVLPLLNYDLVDFATPFCTCMDVIQPGSRGAVRLVVNGSRSQDGSDAGTTLVTSQRWYFPANQEAEAPRFSLSDIVTPAGPSKLAPLCPPTIPQSFDALSLYPDQKAEAGSSIDADILSAQRFLRQHHTDVDLPDYLLSQLLHDNAFELEDTAHQVDGSLGIADAQAIALLGPVTIEQQQVYAIACVGGHNRDCLLLHQVQVCSADDDEFDAYDESQTEAIQAKGKAKAQDPIRLGFKPAHSAERRFHTPILQVLASTDRQVLAVRTHSSTSFYSLQHKTGVQGTLQLHLEILHQVRYGSDGYVQHHDICFRGTGAVVEAASVDQHGNIDLFRFASEDAHPQQDEPTPDPDAAASPVASSSKTRTKGRRSLPPPSPSPALATSSVRMTIKTSRIAIDLAAHLQADAEDHASAAPDPDEAPNDDASNIRQSFRLVFGSNARDLYLLTRHALIHIEPADHDADAEGGTPPRLHTILRSSLCLSSFRRARLFSMATTGPDSEQQLLAVCTSDAIHWFDLTQPSQPLFATSHHRGDDPTLFLTVLPSSPDGAPGSADKENQVSMWALSSIRNDAVTGFVVRARLQDDQGDNLLQTDPSPASSGPRWSYTLDSAPVLLPTASSASRGSDASAAPPLFADMAELLRQEALSGSWLTLRLDARGSLSAQLLRMSTDASSDELDGFDGDLQLHVVEPPSGNLLYVTESENLGLIHGASDSVNNVKTKHLDLRKLHQTIFALERRKDASGVTDDGQSNTASRLREMLDCSSQSQQVIKSSTISFGQILRRLRSEIQSDDLDKDVMDLRSDCRHALSSLLLSPAQGPWSRAAVSMTNCNGLSGSGTDSRIDIIERALSSETDRKREAIASYLPSKKDVQGWSANARRATQESLTAASHEMMSDLAFETEVFVRPRARIMDAGAPTQRPQQRRGTNWTALEFRDIYNFVEEQGETIPPPHIGSVGLSFFAPLRTADIQAEAGGSAHHGAGKKLSETELEALLPSTSSTARLLLSEWQLGEDPTEYTYTDPFEGLHRLPRASRLRGPTARARSRSFSRASSASTEDRSRSRSRSRKQSAAPSLSQSGLYDSQAPSSSYPASMASQSQFGSSAVSPAPPTLVSRRQRHRDAHVSRSQPIRAPMSGFESSRSAAPHRASEEYAAAQSQPAAAPRFGFAGSFGDLTPTASPASSQVGTPTRSHFHAGAASTQIEAGRFGARPAAVDRPPKKKKRASGF